MDTLRVDELRTLATVAPLRAQIDALNLASRRPSPFATFEYIETFMAHDEYGMKEEELLFLAAFEAERLVGYLPLRRHTQRVHGMPYTQIDVLVWHDTDRPHVVALGEDEVRCSASCYDHLLRRKRHWSFLELAFQDAESALNTVPATSPFRFHVRRFESMPNTTVPLAFPSFAHYFQSLASAPRRNVARLCRRLLSAGRVEVVSCTDAAARSPLLDLYLDLEKRSWKQAAAAGILRNPRRVDFFRALCAPDQPFGLGYDFVLLDDLPIAGLVSGEFAGSLHALEMAFDQDYEDLAPGHLLSIMAIRRGIEGRYASFNFNGNYAYYKARMGGVVTPTSAVQIYRVGGLPWLKARAGELKRWLRPPPGAESFNPERRRVSHTGEKDAEEEAAVPKLCALRPERPAEREHARQTLAHLLEYGVKVDRLSGAELEKALPFSARRAKTAA